MSTLSETAVRVVLVDDQELVRSGLRRILRRRDGFEIVAECSDGSEVGATLAGLGATGVDVLVMDLRMRTVDGITATRAVVESGGPPVLVLTTFDDDEMLSGALRAGAAGFLLKDSSADDLIRAVRTVAEGGSWLDPAVTGRVLDRFRASELAPVSAPGTGAADALTARELEVLRAMALGRSNGEIAAELVISELTVKSHVGRIFTKLGLRDRPAAIVYAYDHGLVSPRPGAN
ncbi:response regulator [Nocardioides sp. R1-1]|uniref:response regulator n=1 Tax=Nocardioides sp. R1-1 TaxID=3383502 RepID=UPI0038D1C10B